MIVNIHFNNMHASSTSELYLYQKLRWHAKDNGGSIRNFNFSKTELYDIFPKLLKNKWVTKDKVIKHRSVLTKYKCSNYSARITEYELSSIENFKGFLIASCESFVLKSNNKKQNKKNSPVFVGFKKKGPEDQKSSEKNENKKLGEIFNANISRLMGISLSSVTRWRKYSNTLNYNNYVLFANVVATSSPGVGKPILSTIPTVSGHVSLLEEIRVRRHNGNTLKKRPGFMSRKYGGFTSYSLEVSSSIDIFINKKIMYQDGFKRLQ